MHSKQIGGKDALYDLPAASVVVIRGRTRGKIEVDCPGRGVRGYLCMAGPVALDLRL